MNHSTLSAAERRRLQRAEAIIAKAERLKLAEAQALRIIREKKLYRATHATFESYCKERWGFTRQHAAYLIDFAEVSANLSTTVDNQQLPKCERHARPLSVLTPDQQRRAWQIYLESNPTKHTAAGVAAAAQRVQLSPVNGDVTDVKHERRDSANIPLRWCGSKRITATRIVDLFPKHKIYCEPYAGSAAVLLTKSPSEVEILNDRDGDIVLFFRMLRERGEELQRVLRLTPFARDEHDAAKRDPEPADDLERARRFFVRVRQSYGGMLDDHWAVGYDRNGAPHQANTVDHLHETAERLRRVQIENTNAVKLIKKLPDREDVLIYCDPPYLPEVRTRKSSSFRHEMSGDDHCDLLDLLTAKKKTRIAVSGYHSRLYDARLKNWRRYDFRRVINLAQTGERDRKAVHRVDCLWTNW